MNNEFTATAIFFNAVDAVNDLVNGAASEIHCCDVESNIRDAVANLLCTPEVIYSGDAFDIVSDYSYQRDYSDEIDERLGDNPFSDCKNAEDCVMKEANVILACAFDSSVSDISDALSKVVEKMDDLAIDRDLVMNDCFNIVSDVPDDYTEIDTEVIAGVYDCFFYTVGERMGACLSFDSAYITIERMVCDYE